MKADILEMAVRDGLRQQLPRQQRVQDIDRHIGARLRQRRVMNGLTQQALADRIGVTCRQAHQYENGVSGIAAGRLYTVAQVLGVRVGYFFEGLQSASSGDPTPQQRVLLDLARNFRRIRARKHQEAICLLTRILAAVENGFDTDAWDPVKAPDTTPGATRGNKTATLRVLARVEIPHPSTAPKPGDRAEA